MVFVFGIEAHCIDAEDAKEMLHRQAEFPVAFPPATE
jgi:hypothetical protein